MSDPVYAKLIFNEFHVQYGSDPYGQDGIEIFTARELLANGWETPPLVEEFVTQAQRAWGVDVAEIKDKDGRIIYTASQ